MALDDDARPVSLEITGMNCAACAARVERALAAAPGVSAASVNFARERAEVRPSRDHAATIGALVDAVRDSGFGVRIAERRISLASPVEGAAARDAEARMRAAPGVIAAHVDTEAAIAVARLVRGAPDAPLYAALREAGLRAGAASQTSDEDEKAEAAAADRALRADLILAAILTAPFLAQMAAMALGLGWRLAPPLELALATPVQFLVGRRFHLSALRAVRARSANMDVLVSLGSFAAFFFSLWLLMSGREAGGLYFEASAVIITMVLAGKTMEGRAKRAAASALGALMALRPTLATAMRAGVEVETPVEALEIGDVVVLRPGQRAPVDGVILKGESELDESLLTGETALIPRKPGDLVHAGALNGGGLLKLRAEAVGADDTLARIARMVAAAESGKAPVQRLVDRVAAVFAPAVLALSALTLFGWLAAGAGVEAAFVAGVSVLVIACPCALGLATPVALVAGVGAAARAGILFRDVEALERAARVDAVAFDKTGTLTEGAPTLTDIAVDGVTEAEALRLAASLQQGSEHPLARATLTAASERGLALAALTDFSATAGAGAEASVEGRALRLGRAAFAAPAGAPTLEGRAAAMEDEGRTLAWLSVDGRPVALFGFADEIRADAPSAVAALKRRGVLVAALSGDAAAAVARVADALGVDEVVSGASPADKIAYIEALRARGLRVAMAGDGVNDAPALAAADLGLAMGSGADVARAAAGATLMRARPSLVPAALDIATATSRKIRQNLGWAFLYNLVALPVAAAGMLSPAVAGAAMAASSLCVVLNAAPLARWKPAGS